MNSRHICRTPRPLWFWLRFLILNLGRCFTSLSSRSCCFPLIFWQLLSYVCYICRLLESLGFIYEVQQQNTPTIATDRSAAVDSNHHHRLSWVYCSSCLPVLNITSFVESRELREQQARCSEFSSTSFVLTCFFFYLIFVCWLLVMLQT